KGEVTLIKSGRFVGLKTKKTRGIEKESFIKKKVFDNLGGFNIVTVERDGKELDDKLDDIRKEGSVEVGTHVYYTHGNSNRPVVPTGEIYIIFQDGTSTEEQMLVIDEYNLEIVERRDEYRVIVKVTAKSPNPLKVSNYLQNISLVKLAEPDIDTFVEEYDFSEPNDQLFQHQWHLQNEGQVVDVNWPLKKGADAKVVDAWKRMGNMGSSNIKIAIIDNGFDLTHPDLKNKVHKPYDLWSQSSQIEQGDPRFTHGTPCATVALAASNGSGIVGAAPNAKFVPISGTSFSLRATEAMFNYCIENDVDVISCSWGSTDPSFNLSSLKEEAISKAAKEGRNGKGCVIVYAVGNDDLDFVSFYAAHPDVIAVAASTSKDEHANYSNRGREVTICAPSNGDWPITAGRAWWDEGVSWETGEYRFWRDGLSRGDRYKHFGGTSSSCPLVAGICALILSVNPDLTAAEVKTILTKTADKIGSPSEYSNGHSNKYGYGKINADRAVAEAIRMRDGLGEEDPKVKYDISTGRGIFRFNVSRQDGKGYGVQVGAFAEYGNVLIQAEKLQGSFNEPIIVSINELNGKTVYKIVVGAFAKKSEAVSLQKRMLKEGMKGFLRNLKDLL
ncbi:MAG: subtilisin family serine protease, partial [Patescibacteria group bacterium]